MPPDLVQYLIPALIFLAVIAVGGAFIASAAARRKALRPRLYDFTDAPDGGTAVPGDRPGLKLLHRIGAMGSFGKATSNLERELTRAGFHSKAAPDIYLGIKILMLGIGILGAGAAVAP